MQKRREFMKSIGAGALSLGLPVAAGAQDCLLTLAYAPGISEPLEVRWDIEGGVRPPRNDAAFAHDLIRKRTGAEIESLAQTGRGTHFFDGRAGWNRAR